MKTFVSFFCGDYDDEVTTIEVKSRNPAELIFPRVDVMYIEFFDAENSPNDDHLNVERLPIYMPPHPTQEDKKHFIDPKTLKYAEVEAE